MLDCSKAKKNLNWFPKWNLDEALNLIVEWHKSWSSGGNVYDKSISDIKKYLNN